MQSEVERLKDCLNAREELISGLREDINLRQEKESSYREKVAELYNEIEKSQVVKDVIDFSGTFVTGLEEQLHVAQKILKIKDDEISGLNKAINEFSCRPRTPTSPAPRHESFLDSNFKGLNQKIVELNKQLVEEREETVNAQISIQVQDSQIMALQKDLDLKDLDIKRVEKEYETEMLSMAESFKDQKTVNCEELSKLTVEVETLKSELKDVTREKLQLRESYERVNEERTVSNARLDDPEEEEMDNCALHSKYNMKEQQLCNAIVEIDDMRDNLRLKSETLNELENSLTEQREVNVDLQNLINELKEKCDNDYNKESDYLHQIKESEESNTELKDSLKNARNDLRAVSQQLRHKESLLLHLSNEVIASLRELKSLEQSLKSEFMEQVNYLNLHCTGCVEEIQRNYENSMAQVSAEKEAQIKILEDEVQKYKTTGKKIIDKLKKQLKDKDVSMKRIASDSGDSAAVVFEEENTVLSKKIQNLELDNDKLKDELSGLRTQLQEATHINNVNNINGPVDNQNDPFIKQVESFIIQYQEIYQCNIIDCDLDIEVYNVALPVMIKVAQENVDHMKVLKSDLQERVEKTASMESKISILEEANKNLQGDLNKLHSQIDGKDLKLSDNALAANELREMIECKDKEVLSLSDEIFSLKEELECSRQSVDNLMIQNSENCSSLQQKIKEDEEQFNYLQSQISHLSDSCNCKDLEIAKSSDKIQLLIKDCEDKDSSLTELNFKCEELERTVDTLSSQVSYLADEKESFELSMSKRCEELESSKSSSSEEVKSIKNSLTSKTAECRKYLAMIKKMKMIKESNERKIHELEQKLKNLQYDSEQLSVENIEMTVGVIPEVNCDVQSVVHAMPFSDDSLVITAANLPQVHSSVQTNAMYDSRDAESQSDEVYTYHDDTIRSLQAEVVQLYTELQSVEDSCFSKDNFIADLSEQLTCSEKLVTDTRLEVENKSNELRLEHDNYENLVNQMIKEKNDLLEKEKQLLADLLEKEKLLAAKSSLTEAETVRLMSGKPQVQEIDTISEVSRTSLMSHDTSYMSISSIHKEMPSDVESLQAELMKKNKLAFLIKTKTKKLESRVRDAKREAERSKAHEKVKDKIIAVETELSNITAQLRNLSTGKKIESQVPRIDPKYVEEMESRLTNLTQIEQKYENLMEELQIQIHSRNLAEDDAQQLNHTVNDLEDKVEILQSEIRDKDTLLCEHIDVSADDGLKISTLRDQFEHQNIELLHLRDLNKKMKDALIEVTDESARIEQTYKSTMHELEDEADNLKCDNATLSNELTNCWAKIEDLEEQNQNYMNLLENAHEQLKGQSSDSQIVEGLRSKNEALVAQVASFNDSNKEMNDKVRASEQEKCEVMKQLVELKHMYDECMDSKALITGEKDKLQSLVEELNANITNSEQNYESKLLALDEASAELSFCKAEVGSLKQNNKDFQENLKKASKEIETINLSLSSKLKTVQEANAILRNELEESQYSTETLQQQLNITSEEKSKTSVQLEKVYNQLNDLLSEHEECPISIISLKNRITSIQKQLSDKTKLVESLKEDHKIVMESNIESVHDLEIEIERLSDVCQDKTVLQQELNDMKTAYRNLDDEKLKSEAKVENLTEVESSLMSKLTSLQDDINTISAEKIELSAEISIRLSEIESLKNKFIDAEVAHNDLKLFKEAELDSMEKLLEQSEKSLSQLNLKLESLEDEYSNSSSTISDLALQINEKQKLLDDISDQKQQLEQQNDELVITNSEYLEQLQDASNKLEQWSHYHEEQQKVFVEYQTKLSSLTEQYDTSVTELAECKKQVNVLTTDISNTIKDNQQLDKALIHANDVSSQQCKENEELDLAIVDLRSENEIMEQKLSNYNNDIESLNCELNGTKADLQETVSVRDGLEAQVNELQADILSMSGDNDKIRRENDELQEKLLVVDDISMAECTKLRCQLEESERSVVEKELKIDCVESLLLENEQKLHELEQKENDQKDALAEKSSTIQLLEQQIDDASSGNEEAVTLLTNKNQSLKDENDMLTDKNQKFLESNDTLEEGIAKMHDSIEQSKATIQSYEAMLAAWTSYGEQREIFVLDLNEKLEHSHVTIEKLEASVESKEEQIAEVNHNLDEMNMKLENVLADKVTVDNQLKILSEESSALTQLSDEHKGLKQEMLNLTEALNAANREKESITKKAKDVLKAYKESKISLEKFKKETAEKSNEQTVNHNLQLNDLKKSLADSADSNDALEIKKAELITEVQQFEIERGLTKSLKDENCALKEYLLEHTEKIERLQVQRIDNEVFESELTSARNAKSLADCKLAELQSKLHELEKESSEKAVAIDELLSFRDKQAEELQSKLSEIELRDSEINDLRSTHVQHHRLCEDLGLDFERFDEVIPQLVNELTDKTNYILDINSHIDIFIKNVDIQDLIQWTENNITIGDKFSVICNKMVDLSKKLFLTESELQTLKNKAETLKQEAEVLQSANVSLNTYVKINEELQRKVEFLERDRSEHEHTVELLHQKFESNYQELDGVKTDLSKKEKELVDITNQFQATITKLATAESRMRELEQLISDKDSENLRSQQNFEGQIKHFHNLSAELQNDFFQSKQDVETLRADKDNLEQDLLSQCNKIAIILEEMDGYKSQILALSNELVNAQDGYEQLLSKLQLTEQEYESVSEQLSSKDSIIQHLEDEISSFKRRLDAANSPDKDEELLNAIHQKDDVIEELRSELETLGQEYRKTCENNQQQIQLFDSEKASLSQEVKTLQNNMETLKIEIETKDTSLGLQSNEIKNLQLRFNEAQNSNSYLKKELDESKENLVVINIKFDEMTVTKEKVESEMADLKSNCRDLSTQVTSLTDMNSKITAELTKNKLDKSVLQKSLSEHDKQDNSILISKEVLVQDLNKKLLKSEEAVGEITANFEQKCIEIKAIERDLSCKKNRIFDLETEKGDADRQLSEKSALMSSLKSDFNDLVSTNAALDDKLKKFSLEQKDNDVKKLTSDLEQALVDTKALKENNSLLVANNTQLTDNYKQLHDSVSVYQQRDQYLTDMTQKLQSHIGSLEEHIKKISNDFISKIKELEIGKQQLNEQLSSIKSNNVEESQVAQLKSELSHLSESKSKLVSEVDAYQGRLKAATSKAENLEKTFLDITTRYNDQCGVVEKKTADIAKLTKQYKYLKQKLVNELNNRKSFLQETITGKERVAIQNGEKSKRLKVILFPKLD